MFLNLVTADVVLFDGVDADYAAVYADLFRVLACQLDLLLELHHFVARVLAACPRHHRCRSRVSPAFLRCMQTQRQASSFVATDLPWSPISCASVAMRLFEDPEGLLDDYATFFLLLAGMRNRTDMGMGMERCTRQVFGPRYRREEPAQAAHPGCARAAGEL